jgi:precorrin-3B C17-methyltransferase
VTRSATGRLVVVGLGPGPAEMMTGEARAAVAGVGDLFGYGPYLARVALAPRQVAHASDNREELGRARAALALAAAGRSVAVVSGGDPGVFAMAAAVCEAVEGGPAAWREVEVAVVPGVTAMLAVAARVGAPLGHDFCALSLSDNLKPWAVVEARLRAAAAAGFVLALYNPVSRARPWQLARAFEVLREVLPTGTAVVFGRAVGRADEAVRVASLGEARGEMADMATCVIVGSRETRVVQRAGRAPLVYTPRSFAPAEAVR